jgi:hypothetical protein
MSIEIQARTQWGGGLDFPHLLCSPVVFSQLYLDLSPEQSNEQASAKQSLPGRVNPAENCGESHYLCRELAIALQRTERSATLRVYPYTTSPKNWRLTPFPSFDVDFIYLLNHNVEYLPSLPWDNVVYGRPLLVCMFNACSVLVQEKNTGQPEHHLKHHFIDLQNSAPEN